MAKFCGCFTRTFYTYHNFRRNLRRTAYTSESAAVAGVWAILMGFFIYRELTFKSLQMALRETATITAIIFAIIATATFLSVVLTYSQIPQQIITYFTEMGATFTLFWIALAVICLLLGTFVEIVPVFYLTVRYHRSLVRGTVSHILGSVWGRIGGK